MKSHVETVIEALAPLGARLVENGWMPNDEMAADDFEKLVQAKKNFFAFMQDIESLRGNYLNAKDEDFKHAYICMEQALDELLAPDASRLDEILGGGYELPMSPIQANWLKEQYAKRMSGPTNPATLIAQGVDLSKEEKPKSLYADYGLAYDL